MKKNMVYGGWLMVPAMVLGLVVAQAAPDLRALDTAGMSQWGATHAITIAAGDLTTTATNTAQVFSVPISANSSVQCMGAKLLSAFEVGVQGTNHFYTASLALTAGDTSGGVNYLASMQMANTNASTVYWKGGVRTGTVDNPTNVSVVTVNEGTYYTAATNLYFTVTPSAGQAVATNKTGAVMVLFRIR